MLNHKTESSTSIFTWVNNADKNDIVQMLLAIATRLECESALEMRVKNEIHMAMVTHLKDLNSRVDKTDARLQECEDSVSTLQTDVRRVVCRKEDLENDLSFYCPPD